jgi:AraC-like DNA-binding protein
MPDIAATFAGRFTGYATDRLALSRASMPALRLVRSAMTMARTGFAHFAVQIPLTGALDGTAEERRFKVRSGDIFIMDLLRTIELQTQSDAVTETVTLWFPRARLQPALNNDEAIHGLVLKGDGPAGALIGSCLKSFAADVPRMSRHEMDILGAATIALIARTIVLAISPPHGHTGTATVTLNAVRRFIDQNLLSEELDIDLIAANFGLSRASLYRLFAPIGGVAGYIRKQRLDRTFQELTSHEFANKRIGWIAQRYGFNNTSAFTRVFHGTYGITPMRARRAALQGAISGVASASEAANDAVDGWLKRLRS